MDKEILKKTIKGLLINSGYWNINFTNGSDDILVVSFDSNEITSFKAELPGWTYSGIQLNIGGSGQYKIEFKKTS